MILVLQFVDHQKSVSTVTSVSTHNTKLKVAHIIINQFRSKFLSHFLVLAGASERPKFGTYLNEYI